MMIFFFSAPSVPTVAPVLKGTKVELFEPEVFLFCDVPPWEAPELTAELLS